jgi:hypothetical protein
MSTFSTLHHALLKNERPVENVWSWRARMAWFLLGLRLRLISNGLNRFD